MMPPHRSNNTTKQYIIPSSSSSSNQPITINHHQIQQQQSGNHREILDKIRNDLKPYEQQERYEIQMVGAITNFPQNSSTNFPLNSYNNTGYTTNQKLDDKQTQMIDQLINLGYEKTTAYYALTLVNFTSVEDAASVLNKIHSEIAEKQMNGQQKRSTYFPSQLKQTTSIPQQQQQQQRLPRYITVSSSPASSTSSRQQSSTTTYLNITPDDSRNSSRSESPNTALMYSPITVNNWNLTTNQNIPMRPDYQSSHAKIALKHTTSIDPHNFIRTSPITSNKTSITNMTSAPSSTVMMIERDPMPKQQIPIKMNYESGPVIKTKVDFPVQHQQDPKRIQLNSINSRNILERPQQQNAIQSIIVDPDKISTNYVNYVDQICLKTSRLGKDFDSGISSSNNISPIITTTNYLSNKIQQKNDNKNSSDIIKPKRSYSPLPESVNKKLKKNIYEKFVKPCKPAMYRFFMEQHIDSVVKQYEDRNQRASQLLTEMKAAELNEKIQEKMLKLLRQKESRYIRLKRQKMNKDMFDIIKHIGVGAFGKVALVRKKDTSQCYAMKILSKEDVIQKQQAAHVKAERDILAEANSEWIVKLYFSFQDSRNLYFIMEYVPGGDMMQLLINKGVFTEKLARFYIAELACALEYVHSLGFIHRDIKPDNILIDKEGHIKLTDFGLCTGLRWTHDKRRYRIYENTDKNGISHFHDDSFSLPNENGKFKVLESRHNKKRNEAHSVVGTGNYMAPEVIRKTGHTQACDWWSVGVILYEMVFGRPPFMSQTEDPNETARKIIHWQKYLDLTCMAHLPTLLSDNCIDVIAKLCCEENDRISAYGMKKHPWFRGIDWENLRNTKAEFIPTVKHAEDTSNFDTTDLDKDYDLFKKETLKSHHHFNPSFFDFTFRHFFDGVPTPIGRSSHRPSLPFMDKNHKSSIITINQQNESNSSNNGNNTSKIIVNNITKTTEKDKKLNDVKEIIRNEPPIPAKPKNGFRRTPHVRAQHPRGQLRDLFPQNNHQNYNDNSRNNNEKYQQRL